MMKTICQKVSWLDKLIFLLLLIITSISVYKIVIPLKKDDFVELKVKIKVEALLKSLEKSNKKSFEIPLFQNYRFIPVKKNLNFVKQTNKKVSNFSLYIEKSSYLEYFDSRINNQMHKLQKSIYVFGLLQNKYKIINLNKIIIDQNKCNKKFLTICIFLWLFFGFYLLIDRKFLK